MAIKTIRSRREALGLSPDQLAKEAGVNPNLLVRLEAGGDLPSVGTKVLATLGALEHQEPTPVSVTADGTMTEEEAHKARMSSHLVTRRAALDEVAAKEAQNQKWIAAREAREAREREAFRKKYMQQAAERLDLAEELRRLRAVSGLSQAEMVAYSGYTVSIITRAELGKPVGNLPDNGVARAMLVKYDLAARAFTADS